MRERIRKAMAAVLVPVILIASFSRTAPVYAATKKIMTLATVKSMALSESMDYTKVISKLSLKEIGYKQAVKALKLKKKSLTTFRWSPLLNFHFPEKLNFDQESEFALKPVALQAEIDELKHKLNDTVFEVYRKASTLYVELYSLQESIDRKQKQLASLEKNLTRNKARLLLGQALQKDVDAISGKINNIKSSLATEQRTFEKDKEELSDMIGLDVTSGYYFRTPLTDAQIPRQILDDLVSYTLANDQSYYEAKLDTSVALLNLQTNYRLMSGHYGSDINIISSYVTMAMNGEKIKGNAFKSAYDRFLDKIDSYWQGKKRILFIKIPKLWFKGSLDGVRYIEDEPYALYENVLEYQDALLEQKALAKELEKEVRDSFETLVTTRNSFILMTGQLAEEKALLDKLLVLNRLGECTFEEYSEQQSQYDELSQDIADTLTTYSTLVYNFDRLTCGGVTKYLKERGLSLDGSKGGTSYVVDEEDAGTGAKYYITPIIEDSMFEFGLYIPKDYVTDATDYELIVNGIRIGERTPLDASIRHLSLALDSVDKAVVRLYDGDRFINECEIDPENYYGDLEMNGAYVVNTIENTRVIGTYAISENASGLCSISFSFDPGEGVACYLMKSSSGTPILGKEPIPITKKFEYLGLLASSLEEVTLECYDTNKNKLFEAHFETSENTIYVEAK